MTLTRQQLDDQLLDYLYEELDAGQAAAFAASVEAHPDLTAEVAAHRRTREAAAGLRSVALPAGLLDGVLEAAALSAEAVHNEAASPRVQWWVKLHRLLAQPGFAAAMATVLLVGVGTVILDKGPAGRSSDSPREEAAFAPAEATRTKADEPEAKTGDALLAGAVFDDEGGAGFGAVSPDVAPAARPSEPKATEEDLAHRATPAEVEPKRGGSSDTKRQRPAKRRPAPRPKRAATAGAIGEVTAKDKKGADDVATLSKGTTDGAPVVDRVAPVVTESSTSTTRPLAEPSAPDTPSTTSPYRGVSKETLDQAPARRALPEVPISVPSGSQADSAGAEREDSEAEAARIASLWRRYSDHVEGGRFAEADALLDRLERFSSERTRAQSRRKQLVAARRAKRSKPDDGVKETLEPVAPASTGKGLWRNK